MDYKKKYEEAIDRCKKEFNFNNLAYSHEEIRERLEHVFPELKDNEDERIRKEIIQSIQDNMCIIHKDKCIAWLEKQGEQKANEIHPIFRVGDYIRNKKTSDEVLIEQLDVKAKAYYYTSYDGGAEIHSDFPFSKQDEWKLIGQKSVEQKPAWSEEDEKMLDSFLHKLEVCELLSNKEIIWIKNKFKALKERYTWKPSDEQIEILGKVRKILHANEDIYSKANNLIHPFEELIRTLKKLKEE